MQSSPLPAVGNFEQPVLTIENPQAFGEVHLAVENAFAKNNVAKFFKTLAARNLRIRNFEDVLSASLLGESTRSKYASLGNADQGQIREFYLASLERVDSDLRDKFFKLYAYY